MKSAQSFEPRSLVTALQLCLQNVPYEYELHHPGFTPCVSVVAPERWHQLKISLPMFLCEKLLCYLRAFNFGLFPPLLLGQRNLMLALQLFKPWRCSWLSVGQRHTSASLLCSWYFVPPPSLSFLLIVDEFIEVNAAVGVWAGIMVPWKPFNGVFWPSRGWDGWVHLGTHAGLCRTGWSTIAGPNLSGL